MLSRIMCRVVQWDILRSKADYHELREYIGGSVSAIPMCRASTHVRIDASMYVPTACNVFEVDMGVRCSSRHVAINR